MIYTPLEYSEKFLFQGKKVSAMTIKRRCEKGMLPSEHKARKLPGETGGWVIEVADEVIEKNPEQPKIESKSLHKNHFNLR